MVLKIIDKQKLIYITLLLIYLILAIVIVPIIVPLKEEFQLNFDEGIETMRALLYMKGFLPHKEIWSDHPFLFTQFLSVWFTIFGKSILWDRLLTIVFSSLLAFSGLFFALALQIKFLTVFLIPIIFILIIVTNQKKSPEMLN